MKSTAILLWKWRIRFWKRSATRVFSSDRTGDVLPFVLLSHKNVDAKKWNECIRMHHGSIYAEFEFLNFLCQKWDAVVLGDYEFVFPLAKYKKLGFTCYANPPFMQRMQGVGVISGEQLKLVYRTIRKRSLSARFTSSTSINNITSIKATNYLLPLGQGFDLIGKRLKSKFISEFRKSCGFEIKYAQGSSNELIRSWASAYQEKCNIKHKDLQAFQNMCAFYTKENRCHVRIVMQGKKIVAGVILLEDEHRLYNLLNYVSRIGREQKANYFLYYNLLAEFADKNLIFDFEGSDIPGVKTFYKKFNPDVEYYYKCNMKNPLAAWRISLGL